MCHVAGKNKEKDKGKKQTIIDRFYLFWTSDQHKKENENKGQPIWKYTQYADDTAAKQKEREDKICFFADPVFLCKVDLYGLVWDKKDAKQ